MTRAERRRREREERKKANALVSATLTEAARGAKREGSQLDTNTPPEVRIRRDDGE